MLKKMVMPRRNDLWLLYKRMHTDDGGGEHTVRDDNLYVCHVDA